MAMRIVVCVKPVPRAAVGRRLDPAALRLDRSGPSELNPPDEYAVEEALLIRDRVGAEVVALAMTPDSGVESLRTPLAMGVDRAIAVRDPALEGSDLVVTARVLALALARETPDLIIFGSQAEDGGGAMLWGAIGDRLRLPVIAGGRNVQLIKGRLRVTRQWADSVQTVEAPLPSIVALSGSVNTPRYPSLRGIVAAKRQSIPMISIADLGLQPEECGTAGSRTRVLSVAPAPPRRTQAEIVKDEGHGAEWLVDFILQRMPL